MGAAAGLSRASLPSQCLLRSSHCRSPVAPGHAAPAGIEPVFSPCCWPAPSTMTWLSTRQSRAMNLTYPRLQLASASWRVAGGYVVGPGLVTWRVLAYLTTVAVLHRFGNRYATSSGAYVAGTYAAALPAVLSAPSPAALIGADAVLLALLRRGVARRSAAPGGLVAFGWPRPRRVLGPG